LKNFTKTPKPSGGSHICLKKNILLWGIIIILFQMSIWGYAFDVYQVQQLRATYWCIKCDLSGSNFAFSMLVNARLHGANLTTANLSGANMEGADLSGANLSESNLSGANLSQAILFVSNLSNANLNGANLSGANLANSNLSGANITRADLSGADLSNAIWINGLECSKGSLGRCRQ
jgi:uncharacterized protein YjbI with pentapeptide repeats